LKFEERCDFKQLEVGTTIAESFLMMKTTLVIERASDAESFDNVSEEEIIFLWRTFKANGLTSDQAWHAIVTGMALDMAFDRSKKVPQVEH
jgi:hypothetical protein